MKQKRGPGRPKLPKGRAARVQYFERRHIDNLPPKYDGAIWVGQRWFLDLNLEGMPVRWFVESETRAGTVTLRSQFHSWILGAEDLVRLGTPLTETPSSVIRDTDGRGEGTQGTLG